MTQKEIYDIEKENLTRIYFYREGIFWKAYEKSAYQIVRVHEKFKPIKKFVRNIGEQIVSIGFPCASQERYIPENRIVSRSEGHIVAEAESGVDSEGFERWKEEIALAAPRRGKAVAVSANGNEAPVAPSAGQIRLIMTGHFTE